MSRVRVPLPALIGRMIDRGGVACASGEPVRRVVPCREGITRSVQAGMMAPRGGRLVFAAREPSRDVRPRQKGSHRDAETRRGTRKPIPPSYLLRVLCASACDLLGSRRATSGHARRAHTDTRRREGGPETNPPSYLLRVLCASACDLLGSRRATSGHARRAHTDTRRREGGPETSPPPSCLLCVLCVSACDLLGSRRATWRHARGLTQNVFAEGRRLGELLGIVPRRDSPRFVGQLHPLRNDPCETLMT
jgi:hypothetical protein